MKKLISAFLAALLIFPACSSDHDNVDYEAVKSLAGTYVAISRETKSTEKVEQLDSKSYVTLNDDCSGLTYDASTGQTRAIRWQAYSNKNQLRLYINDRVCEGTLTDKSADIINYKELSIDVVEKMFDVNYKLIKADINEDGILQPIVNIAESTTETAIAMNRNRMIAKVERNADGALSFVIGRLGLDLKVKWIAETEKSLPKGKNVSVALNNEMQVFVSFYNEDSKKIDLYGAYLNRETFAFEWTLKDAFDTNSNNVSAAILTDFATEIFVVEEKDNNITFRHGLHYTSRITWKTAEGEEIAIASDAQNPKIAVDDNNNIAIVYESNGNVYCKAGLAEKVGSVKSFTWGEPVLVCEGMNPAVSINIRGDIVIAYSLKDVPYSLYKTGKISNKKVELGASNYLGQAIPNSVFITSIGEFLTARSSNGSQSISATKLIDYSKIWMGKLADNAPLSSVSLPGTHDAAAIVGGNIGKCQSLTISEQLDAGVRFLDIRAKYVNGKLKLYHGILDLYNTFDQVYNECIEFLDQHPEEALVFSVRNENDGASLDVKRLFQNTVYEEYLDKYPDRWFEEDRVPTVAEARNRITLFRRFKPMTKVANEGDEVDRGIEAFYGWKDNRTFTLGKYLTVQDTYDTSDISGKKRSQVEDLLDEAISGDKNMIYVNFLSATGGFFGPSPRDVAQGGTSKVPTGMLEYFDMYMSSHKGKKRLGWLLFDFPNYSHIETVINSNF